MKVLKSWVCGEWHEGTGKRADLHDPVTEEKIAETGTGGVDFAAVLEHARGVGGPALRGMSFAERGAMLMAMANSIHARRDELLDLARINGGNTRGDAKFDVDGATGTLSAYAKWAEALGDARYLLDGEPVRLSRGARYVGRHVLVPQTGAAIHINAFNFPAWGMAEKAAVALLAGVPVVTKPVRPEPLPAARTVVEFTYPELPSSKRRWWLMVTPDREVDLCWSDPGFEVNLYVTTDLRTMTSIWMGLATVAEAREKMRIDGDRGVIEVPR